VLARNYRVVHRGPRVFVLNAGLLPTFFAVGLEIAGHGCAELECFGCNGWFHAENYTADHRSHCLVGRYWDSPYI